MTPETFEDRLLTELRQIVAVRPNAEPVHAPTPTRHRRRPRMVAGATATAAVAATALVIAAGGDPAVPAYAVERQPDGSVTVKINSLRDADGLERKLRAAGIPAVVDYAPAGKTCRGPRGDHPRDRAGAGRSTFGQTVGSNGAATFTVPRGHLADGQSLVITSSLGAGLTSVSIEIVEGPVAPCTLVDAPPIPAAPGGPAGGSAGGEQGLSSRTDDRNGPSTHVGL